MTCSTSPSGCSTRKPHVQGCMTVLATPARSPQPKGRKTIAQRFIAGEPGQETKRVPPGTKERPRLAPAFFRPSGAGCCFGLGHPPLKRWAMVGRPCGTLWRGRPGPVLRPSPGDRKDGHAPHVPGRTQSRSPAPPGMSLRAERSNLPRCGLRLLRRCAPRNNINMIRQMTLRSPGPTYGRQLSFRGTKAIIDPPDHQSGSVQGREQE